MVARRGIEAPSRRHPWFTPDDLLRWKHRECRPMATVNLTARYLDLLKPQRKRYAVRHHRAGLRDSGHAGWPQVVHALLPTPRPNPASWPRALPRHPPGRRTQGRHAAPRTYFRRGRPRRREKGGTLDQVTRSVRCSTCTKRIGRRPRAGRRRDGLWNARSCRSGGISA